MHDMRFTTLGRTGLRVSVAGLGCGGFSRLGQGTGKSEEHSIDVVRAALDSGINFLDTAEAYGTEAIVGKAVKPSERDDVVVSTKTQILANGVRKTPDQVVASLEESLVRLGMDRVDVFHLHAVAPAHVDYAITEIAPALVEQRARGKIAHLGITETSPNDHTHKTLPAAVQSGLFDVVMVGFHLMHQNARESVFSLTQEHGVGTLLMFAVRLIFSQPERLRKTLSSLVETGQLPGRYAGDDGALDFLNELGGPLGIIDAAYRYGRHEPGVDVTLLGTGDIDHLHSNTQSILGAPLAEDVRDTIRAEFGHLVGVGLDKPNR
jgi:aryl-alcohol dehydrogenase-like predicted oxidoreductase